MPARRLPWIKLWPEAMRHEKVAMLSDGAFRAWVMALAAAAEQTRRWRFASVEHLLRVTGRAEAEAHELISVHLLDISPRGEVWIHDWEQWQERYESDLIPRTLRNGSANAPRSLPPDGRRETGDLREETLTTPLPPPPAEGERQAGGTILSADLPTRHPRRRRRTDVDVGPLDAAPPPEVPPLSPLAPTDAALWARCREQLRDSMSLGNWSILIEPLEPLGRATDGGLYLRAPPLGQGVGKRALNHVRKALLDQGEERAQQSAIIEA